MTTRNLDELQELIEHLLTQWELYSDGGTYRQPAARRGGPSLVPTSRGLPSSTASPAIFTRRPPRSSP